MKTLPNELFQEAIKPSTEFDITEHDHAITQPYQPKLETNRAGFISERFFKYQQGVLTSESKLGFKYFNLGPISIPYPAMITDVEHIYPPQYDDQEIQFKKGKFGPNYDSLDAEVKTFAPNNYINDSEFQKVRKAFELSINGGIVDRAKAYKDLILAYLKRDNIIQAQTAQFKFHKDMENRLTNKNLVLNLPHYWFNPLPHLFDSPHQPPPPPDEVFIFKNRSELVNIKYDVSIAVLEGLFASYQKDPKSIASDFNLYVIDYLKEIANIEKNRNVLLAWISCYNHFYDKGSEAVLTKFDPQFADLEDYHPPEWHELIIYDKIMFYVRKYEVIRLVAAELHTAAYAFQQGVEQYLVDQNIEKVTHSMDLARKLSDKYVDKLLNDAKLPTTASAKR